MLLILKTKMRRCFLEGGDHRLLVGGHGDTHVYAQSFFCAGNGELTHIKREFSRNIILQLSENGFGVIVHAHRLGQETNGGGLAADGVKGDG